jgi:serine O-acetyltransferase
MGGDGAARREIAASSEPAGLAQVADALAAVHAGPLDDQRRHQALPDRGAIAAVMDDLRAVLFPGHFGTAAASGLGRRADIGLRLARVERALTEQVGRGLSFSCDHAAAGSAGGAGGCRVCDARASQVTAELLGRLPALRAVLESDVQAAYAGDPAARFLDETLLCYPGVAAVIQHRVAHEIHTRGVPLIPRIIAQLAHATTGIDIHPGAVIGDSFFIDHGTGVVIGETCAIGQRVRVYQGVTLGARGFPSDEQGHPLKGLPRHPVVEDDVVIFAGATILGRITIGRGATIGGNVWLTRSVAPGARVTQAQVRHELFENGSGI